MSLWEYIYTPFKFPKGHKIRLFEAFSGIGCQAMALKRITEDSLTPSFNAISVDVIKQASEALSRTYSAMILCVLVRCAEWSNSFISFISFWSQFF